MTDSCNGTKMKLVKMAADNKVHYKCCSNQTLKTVVCIKCGQAFHRGCKERAWSDAEIIGPSLIDCCGTKHRQQDQAEQTHVDEHVQKIESLYSQLLKSKTEEIQTRDELLRTKDKLIKELEERIQYLTNKTPKKSITSKSTLTYSEEAGTNKNITAVARVANTHENIATQKQNKPTPVRDYVRDAVNIVTNQQLDAALKNTENKLANMQAAQQETMDMVMNLEQTKEEEEFIMVKRRR